MKGGGQMNKFMGHNMKRKMEGSGSEQKRGSESSAEDFYCPDSGGTHKSTGKIQLSIICSDLIAMVTGRWKILIRPALTTMGWWKETNDSSEADGERGGYGTARVFDLMLFNEGSCKSS